MNAVIICNGDIRDYNRCKIFVQNAGLVLCVDGGARHLKPLEDRADVLLGDLDSIHMEDYEELNAKDIKIMRFPAQKDMTDTELAIGYALERGADTITVIGGLGTRFDHSLANVMLLKTMMDKGIRGSVTDGINEVTLIKDRVVLEREEGVFITLLPLTQKVEGVTTTGLFYPLKDAVIPMGSTWGVSNEFSAEQAEITIKKGLLMVIKSRD